MPTMNERLDALPAATQKMEAVNIAESIRELRRLASLAPADLAKLLGTSFIAVDRWERGDTLPPVGQARLIAELLNDLKDGKPLRRTSNGLRDGTFASRGSTRRALKESQFDCFVVAPEAKLSDQPLSAILQRLKSGRFFRDGKQILAELFDVHSSPAPTPESPLIGPSSAGKNTYTYDAHTYHTKVPPQGIVEFLRYYLPQGGLALDPFSGSGMTGVACRMTGTDVVLNELSPAACFITHNFTEKVSPEAFAAGLRAVLSALASLRKSLYTTACRECGKETEILYTVWSYRVICPRCQSQFVLWDHCRRYGKSVKEHKILSAFPCPSCKETVRKSTLKRTTAIPVLLGYKCCKKIQIEHPLNETDFERVRAIDQDPPLAKEFFPTNCIPDGVNLNQPKRHGLDRIDRFYTNRNLSALSHLWREIHRIENIEIASQIAFVFTSLYQRVTRLSEFRFWGGSGNTAHFNVPFIFNEANVFVTFARKAGSILDHLETTAEQYSGRKVVVCNSATTLDYLPNDSIDFIFTDPPFGANINYSEMNILWESWLGEFTDATDEAIVSRHQGKSLTEYEGLMARSLSECYRVLRPGHWMLLVFMNSSGKVWDALKSAVERAGFVPERIDIFDKQHGTFKQFVSENTAGCDLVLHCRKPYDRYPIFRVSASLNTDDSIKAYLDSRTREMPTTVFLHVNRKTEVDFRMLYSEWVAFGLLNGHELADFSTFRTKIQAFLSGNEWGEDKNESEL